MRTLLAGLPILDIEPGFWERAGLLRASVILSWHDVARQARLLSVECAREFKTGKGRFAFKFLTKGSTIKIL